MSSENKKTEEKAPVTEIIAGILCVVLMGYFGYTLIFKSIAEDRSDSSVKVVPPPQIVYEQMEISVTSQNIKQVDGKYRYFFNIKNNDNESFTGDINIDLISAEGKSIYDKDFQNASIEAGIAKNVYIDISTGPVQVHGVNGIANFEFTASKGEQTIKNGGGSIAIE